MIRQLLLMLTLLVFHNTLPGQEITDFEDLYPGVDTFRNGANADGGFATGSVWLPNDYSAEFNAWTGWAISSTTDTLTPGFVNQYSAIPGQGADNSDTYAVGYAFDPEILHIQDSVAPAVVNEIYITNNTYTYFSMRDGDAFSKKFGGVTGQDPDFLLLTIKGFNQGELVDDSVAFYLADYRSDSSENDYLIEDWTAVDLSLLGPVDSLQFSMSSSDVGDFGMNTPAFFSIDQISIESTTTRVREEKLVGLEIFPNPVQDQLHMRLPSPVLENTVYLYDARGGLVLQRKNLTDVLDLQPLTSGLYFLRVETPEGNQTVQILKY